MVHGHVELELILKWIFDYILNNLFVAQVENLIKAANRINNDS